MIVILQSNIWWSSGRGEFIKYTPDDQYGKTASRNYWIPHAQLYQEQLVGNTTNKAIRKFKLELS